ncbi:glyoxalase superfamily protein [Paenibacillus sp. EC2-1]|uniref:glyoxalase superfamily protein n=1 Tax=Paenibacillus sp. EC2-1 TaxID=3388665 RepID=UPI003BEF343F
MKQVGSSDISMNAITPILRIFDENKAKEFYLEFLDFTIDWEHRYEDNMPLYMQISLGGCVIHLSEHHGDCCPGSAIRVQTQNIEELHKQLNSKGYKYMRPGLEMMSWGTMELSVVDPFGNRIHFYQDRMSSE